MNSATQLTLGEASRLTGKGKTTLARMIKRGALSATRTEVGTYLIDAAELHRAVPFPAPGEPASSTNGATGGAVHEATPCGTPGELIATLREIITDLRGQRADLIEQRDHWQRAAESAQKLLTGPTITPPPPRPWWKRIAG